MSSVTTVNGTDTAASTATKPQAPATQETGTNFEGVLSLLSLGSVQPQSNDNISPQAPATDNRAPQRPDAAPKPAAQPTTNNNNKEAREAAATAPQPKTETQPRPQAPARPEATPLKPLAAQQENNSQQKPQQTTTPATGTTSQQNADALEETAEQQEKIRQSLESKLEDINLLLSALIQAFTIQFQTQQTGNTNGDATITVAASQTVTATGEQNVSLQDLLAQFASLTGNSLAPQSEGGVSLQPLQNLTPEETVSVLKDIQSQFAALLQTLREAAPAQTKQQPTLINTTPQQQETLLAPTAPQQATTTAAEKPLLPQLTEFVARLTQKLQPILARIAPEERGTIDISVSQPQAQTSLNEKSSLPLSQQVEEFFISLKESITSLRQDLQQLQQQNEANFTQVKNALQQQFEQAQQFFRSAPAVAATPAVFTPEAPEPIAPAAAPNSTAGFVTTVTAQAVIAAAPSENFGGQQGSSQQQSQNQPQTIGAASAPRAEAARPETAPASFTRSLERAAPQPVAEQVAFQVKQAATKGASEIRIQLDPADLGKLEIKLTVESNGKTGVHIIADSRHTLDLLQRDSQGLARALNDAGLSADSSSLSFNLRGDGQQGQDQRGAQASQQYRKSQPEETAPETVLAALPHHTATSSEGELDIMI